MELLVNIERVSISNLGTASCPKCHKLSSRVHTTDEATREKTVTCKACSHRLGKGRVG